MIKPIIFNTEMVKAILIDEKLSTRRPVKGLNPSWLWSGHIMSSTDSKIVGCANWVKTKGAPMYYDNFYKKPPYEIGDIIYIRETWKRFKKAQGQGSSFHVEEFTAYRADKDNPNHKKSSEWYDGKWKPSIHMPKKYARLFLKVTNVRVERVQDITEEDAKREGVLRIGSDTAWKDYLRNGIRLKYAKDSFMSLWDSIYSNWDENPWVWVIDFKVVNR